MCSRFQLKTPSDEIADFFAIEDFPDWEPQMEIRPTDFTPVIDQPGHAVLMGFGLPAPWDVKMPVLNARAETITEKSLFQPLLNKRCLVPASGYYEWRATGTGKRKNLISTNQNDLFVFAGLTNGEHFAIVTCAPAPEIAHIHNRMPVILTTEGGHRWLDPTLPFLSVINLLRPFDGKQLSAREDLPPPPAQGDLFG